MSSDDVNEYSRSASGGEFTAKDFRTWAGTVLAAWALQELGEYASQAEAKRHVVAAGESVCQAARQHTLVVSKVLRPSRGSRRPPRRLSAQELGATG